MATWVCEAESRKSADLCGEIIHLCKQGERVKFLTAPGRGASHAQRCRVALSRSRKRNLKKGKKIDQFTLRHTIHSHTEGGRRFDCVVMWIERKELHELRALLDDVMENQNV